ncbi:hypothetical protein [Massilia consociata]|uniref:Uncharacterized protein n=1 Tax=Massilia consociata TaxID=760117 RepID=A0ABV6FGL0_9BURK
MKAFREKRERPPRIEAPVNGQLVENDKEQSGAEPVKIRDLLSTNPNRPHRAIALF